MPWADERSAARSAAARLRVRFKALVAFLRGATMRVGVCGPGTGNLAQDGWAVATMGVPAFAAQNVRAAPPAAAPGPAREASVSMALQAPPKRAGDGAAGPAGPGAPAKAPPGAEEGVVIDRRKQRDAEVLYGGTLAVPGPVTLGLLADVEGILSAGDGWEAGAATPAVASGSSSRAADPSAGAGDAGGSGAGGAAGGGGGDPAQRPRQPSTRAAPSRKPRPVTKITFAPETQARAVIVKEEVFVDDGPPMRSRPSFLTLELKKSGAVRSLPNLRLTIYLPTKMPFQVSVPPTATVEDVVQSVVRMHRRDDVSHTKPLPSYDSRCYELRLPDSDDPTLPDEDIPALDRNRKIKGFSDDLEFCLCLIPGAIDSVGREAPEVSTSKRVRVLMPFPYRPSPCQVLLTPRMTVRQLLDHLVSKYRLALWIGYPQFYVRLSVADAQRLRPPSPELHSDVIIEDLGVEQLELVKRTFADVPNEAAKPAGRGLESGSPDSDVEGGDRDGRGGDDSADDLPPPVPPTAAVAGGGAGAGAGGGPGTAGPSGAPSRPEDRAGPVQGLNGFIHTIVTAARYEEWEVVKVNKRGRRQLRLMGIDLTRITNKKVEKRRFGSSETYRAERLLADILKVEYVEDDKVFFITYRESAVEEVTLEYEAKSEADRAAIVYKLEFILSLEDRSKIVTKRAARP